MGNFTDLAPELILEILSYLEFERATLCQLALASTRFRALAQQALLKHLVLQVDLPENGSTSPFDHVVNILDRDPKLQDLVRTLIISWSAPSPLIQPRLSAFLRRLQWLECLHISTNRMLDTFPGPQLTFDALGLPENSLTRLKRFRRSGGLISWTALEEFVNLPSVIDISLQYPPPRFPRSRLEDCFASLRRLELGNWKGPRNNDPLAALLEKTTSLEALHISMYEENHTPTLSAPSQISQVLSAVRHTLKSLTIDGPPRHERSLLDLTGFASLQRIRAFADLFYHPKRPDRVRDGMHWLLPKTLIDLELAFVSHRGFILRTRDPRISEKMTVLSPDLEEQWVAQLAINKVVHFPGLQSVSIIEDVRNYRLKAENLKFPEKLLSVFEANSITFRTRSRVVDPHFIHRFDVEQ